MRIGVVGTGLMGKPIAHRLIECGYVIVVYNRTVEKTHSLKAVGATVVEDITSLITLCDVIILTVTDSKAIANILFDQPQLPKLDQKTVIQMGTISPSQSQVLRQKVLQSGGNYLEAPVLGSIPEAKTGKLLIMVGGTQREFNAHRTLFASLGEHPRYIGPVGSSAALKLSLNHLIGALTTAFSTSLEFGKQYDVPQDIFMEILRDSALHASTFDKKLKRIQERNFENPNFPTKHLLKDMTLFTKAAAEVKIDTATSQAIAQIVQRAMKDFADQDYSALSTAIKH